MKIGTAHDTSLDQPILLDWAQALFAKGLRTEPRAILDGFALEFGFLPDAAAILRKQCVIKGQSLPPLPTVLPSNDAPATGHSCPVCGTSQVRHETFHERNWLLCPECALLTVEMHEEQAKWLDKGEPSGAKQPAESLVHCREYTFCRRVIDGLNIRDVMNYGVGWSLVPEALLAEGLDVVGCDLWQPLIEQRKRELGEDRFVHRDECPDRRFSLISAFEVFEHFTDPLGEIKLLVDHLKLEGGIIGSTDFWHGGSLSHHPSADPTYWHHGTHVTAWTWKSLSEAARRLNMNVRFFRGDCPEHSAKCFFMLYRGDTFDQFAKSLPKVLPDVYGMTINIEETA